MQYNSLLIQLWNVLIVDIFLWNFYDLNNYKWLESIIVKLLDIGTSLR